MIYLHPVTQTSRSSYKWTYGSNYIRICAVKLLALQLTASLSHIFAFVSEICWLCTVLWSAATLAIRVWVEEDFLQRKSESALVVAGGCSSRKCGGGGPAAGESPPVCKALHREASEMLGRRWAIRSVLGTCLTLECHTVLMETNRVYYLYIFTVDISVSYEDPPAVSGPVFHMCWIWYHILHSIFPKMNFVKWPHRFGRIGANRESRFIILKKAWRIRVELCHCSGVIK